MLGTLLEEDTVKTTRRVAAPAAALLLSATALAGCGDRPAAGAEDRPFPYPPVQYWKRAV